MAGGVHIPPFLYGNGFLYHAIYKKTSRDFEHFARYYIGNKGKLARELFAKLKGTTEDPENCILQMDLMETQNNLLARS